MYLLFLFSLEVRVHLCVKVACAWLSVNAVHVCTCMHIGHVECNVMSPSFGVLCHPPLSTRVPNQVPEPSESSVVWISSYLRHFQRRGDGLARVC